MQNEKKRKLHLVYILLALVVACGMWFYVDEHSNNGGPRVHQTEITDIPIEYVNADKLAGRGLMMLKEQTTRTADITFEGIRRQVARLERDKVRLTVDLSDVTMPGIQFITYKISYTDPRIFADEIQIKQRSSATVHISELDSKEVEVRCELIGGVAEGYSAGQLELSQEMIEIRGQAQDIDLVSYVKVTLDIGDAAVETVSKSLPLQYYDRNGQLLSAEGIHPAVEEVQVTMPVSVTKELRLKVDFLETEGARARNVDVKIQPETITVSGDASRLRNVETILLGEIDLMELAESGQATHYYPIIIPDGCKNLSGVTRATLQISFKDMAKTTVTTSAFAYRNLPTGKKIEILTEELPIRIFGTAEDVAAVNGEDIVLTADLANYAAASGTYTVPATVRINTAGDIGVLGTYQVQVTIREWTEESEKGETLPESGNSGETGSGAGAEGENSSGTTAE